MRNIIETHVLDPLLLEQAYHQEQETWMLALFFILTAMLNIVSRAAPPCCCFSQPRLTFTLRAGAAEPADCVDGLHLRGRAGELRQPQAG